MTKKILSNNNKILQQQIVCLNNEIEELQLEREESKKNVLHFMQEADVTRQELRKAQALIDELATASHQPHSPPPEKNDDDKKPKIALLLLKISVLDENQINTLLELLDQPPQQDTKAKNLQLQDELDQLQQEYIATRGALQIENERADIIEKRWKESESLLEQAESTIQALNSSKQQEWTTTKPENSLSEKLRALEKQYATTMKQLENIESEKEGLSKSWQEKHQFLLDQYSRLENKDAAAKIKENHLKTIIKTLRDEIRKVNKAQQELINIEYLRNVVIQFLEKRNTRAQLIPILSTLLQCSNDDQARLFKLTTMTNTTRRRII